MTPLPPEATLLTPAPKPAMLTPATPKGRINRSTIQTIIGLLVSLPTVIASNHISLSQAGKYGGTAVGCVLAISILQNVVESQGWLKSGG